MTRQERENLMDCLTIIYSITREMQQVCEGLEDRMPPADASRFVKETVLQAFSIVFEGSQERLLSAALTLAAKLENVTVPQVPKIH